MKMKKFFALMLAVVMCLGLLAGCGQEAGDDATDAPATDAPATDAPATDAPEGGDEGDTSGETPPDR